MFKQSIWCYKTLNHLYHTSVAHEPKSMSFDDSKKLTYWN